LKFLEIPPSELAAGCSGRKEPSDGGFRIRLWPRRARQAMKARATRNLRQHPLRHHRCQRRRALPAADFCRLFWWSGVREANLRRVGTRCSCLERDLRPSYGYDVWHNDRRPDYRVLRRIESPLPLALMVRTELEVLTPQQRSARGSILIRVTGWDLPMQLPCLHLGHRSATAWLRRATAWLSAFRAVSGSRGGRRRISPRRPRARLWRSTTRRGTQPEWRRRQAA